MNESVSNMAQSDDDEKKSPPNTTDKDNLEEENDNDHQNQSSSSSASTLPKPKQTNRLLKSLRTFFVGLFPVFGWFTVCPHHASSDLFAGVYLGLYQIPQCMAYSIIAKYPVVYLLRTNIISSVLYTVFGHHRRLSYGIFGLVSAIYFRIIIDRLGFDDTPPEMAAIVVTFLTGLFAMLAGLLHLGSLIRFIPYEVLSGYRAGVYVLIISLLVSPMSAWKSLKIGNGKQLMIVPDLFENQLLPYLPKQLNWNGWLVSIGCMIILACFRILHHYWDCWCRGRWGWLRQTIRRIPVGAILIIIGIIVAKNVHIHSYRIFRFSTINLGNETLISYPHHFQWTSFGQYFGRIWPECIHATILFVIYTHSLAIEYNIADTGRINRKKPKRHLYPKKMKFFRMGWRLYNVNQELRAKGLIDLVGSFFKCVPCGPSRIRSDRCRNVGACTQMSGLVASIVAMVVWLIFQGFLTLTPKCIAASIVTFDTMVALLFEFKLFVNFWKVSIVDAVVWCLTFASFILLNIEMSLYCSIGLSLLIYCFRTKNFKLFKFKQERALITSNNSVVLVPESLLDSSVENTQDDGDSNILQKIPKCVLKSITIYKVDQRLMTVSDIDGFVLDICRKITQAINNSNPINRIIFDCRSFYYTDWASIRLIKAMVMRTIQVAESWTPAALSSSFTMSTTGQDDKLKKRLIAVFLFPTRTVKMIHNGGLFNIDYYHSLHQTLHITMKGAINMVVNFPQRLMDYDQNNNYLDTVSSAGTIMNKTRSGASSRHRSKEDIRATVNGDKINVKKSNKSNDNNSNHPDSKPRKPAKSKLTKLPGKLMNLDCKRQKGILHHENAEKSNENIQRGSITAISFKKQNLDEEFELNQPSTSTHFPRFQIVDEQSLASQSDISAMTSFFETDSESERSERSESIVSILEPPPPSPSLPKSNDESQEKPTTSSQTTVTGSTNLTNLSEISSKEDETSDNGIEIIRPKVSDMKNILEKLLSGQS